LQRGVLLHNIGLGSQSCKCDNLYRYIFPVFCFLIGLLFLSFQLPLHLERRAAFVSVRDTQLRRYIHTRHQPCIGKSKSFVTSSHSDYTSHCHQPLCPFFPECHQLSFLYRSI
jgi:hypothetical protein